MGADAQVVDALAEQVDVLEGRELQRQLDAGDQLLGH
jgi:hypothetical protein